MTDPTFAIIGAGMSGILAGIKLQEAGLNFTIYEKADAIGGTWRENTYPGIACDVPSHIYSYSFALNPDWSRFCSPGSEIQAYFESVVDRYVLEPHIRFGDAVVSATWNDNNQWEVVTASGHTDTVDFVIAATGVLHHPKMPDIDGLDSFDGEMWHSAQWNHDVDLSDKRLALVGTGSTGVQITGALAGQVPSLTLFQRSAQWVVPVEQTAYDDEQKEAFRTDADLLQGTHERLSKIFNDGFATTVLDAESGVSDQMEALCREQLATIVDPELRAKLEPDYRAGCKRLVVSHNFYDAIQHPDVHLVTDGIERVEPGGVRTTDGALHEVDVIVLATGYHVDAFMRPMQIAGMDGRMLDDAWAERPSAYLAVAVPDFPNFFMLNGPNSPVGNFSLIQTAEYQIGYIMQLVDVVRAGQREWIMPTAAAAEAFETERVEAAQKTVWATGCRSWYLDDRGIPFAWPFPFQRFRDEMAEPKLNAWTR